MRASNKFVGGLTAVSLAFGSLAAPAYAKPPRSEIDKAIGKCVASVAIGGVLGALAGGRHHAGQGALAGAAIGGVVCVVLLKAAKDKQAMLDIQRQQVAMGGVQTTSFNGQEGDQLVMTTTVRDVTPAALGSNPPSRFCRYADSNVEIVGTGSAPLGNQLYCRNDAGDWEISAQTT